MSGISTRVLALLLAVTACDAAFGEVRYKVIDLGTLGGYSSEACGLNNAGQVVGRARYSELSTTQHAFLYSNGTMTDLGTLGGYNSVARAINDAGQVVGGAQTSTSEEHAFLYSGGVMTDLHPNGWTDSGAYGINDSGQIVGRLMYYTSRSHPFVYSAGAMKDLGTLGGSWAVAGAINNAGQIVGGSEIQEYSSTFHAFLYSEGAMTDLGTMAPSTFSAAYDINDLGQIVGESLNAMLWHNGQMSSLGTLPSPHSYYSEAYGINAAGSIVGASFSHTMGMEHAFLYCDGTMVDLNSLIDPRSGWTLRQATDINDLGQIVGWGETATSGHRAFLLIPEPATLSLLAVGGAALLGRRRRRAR